MAISSAGYEGTVDEPQWSDLLANGGGRQYAVADDASWKVTAGTADREVRIAVGRGYGYGVLAVSDAVASVTLPAPASGSRYDLIVAHRDWQANTTTFTRVAGSAVRAIPNNRAQTPGTVDDQPIALVRVTAGQSQVTEIVDLRVVGGESGTYAFDELVLQYLNRLASQVRINGRQWVRELDSLGSPRWVDIGVGRLLSVVRVPFVSLPPSGLPSVGAGVSVWGNAVQNVAVYNLEDPGVPFRVQMYAEGFWGNEVDASGRRHDFDMMVGSSAIATKLPAADEFYFGNWRSWSPPPSEQVFTGPQALAFRARRIGDGYGAIRTSDSRVTAWVYSA